MKSWVFPLQCRSFKMIYKWQLRTNMNKKRPHRLQDVTKVASRSCLAMRTKTHKSHDVMEMWLPTYPSTFEQKAPQILQPHSRGGGCSITQPQVSKVCEHVYVEHDNFQVARLKRAAITRFFCRRPGVFMFRTFYEHCRGKKSNHAPKAPWNM